MYEPSSKLFTLHNLIWKKRIVLIDGNGYWWDFQKRLPLGNHSNVDSILSHSHFWLRWSGKWSGRTMSELVTWWHQLMSWDDVLQWDNPFMRTLEVALRCEGDAGTITSMACSLSGARQGSRSIPPVVLRQCQGVDLITKVTRHLMHLVKLLSFIPFIPILLLRDKEYLFLAFYCFRSLKHSRLNRHSIATSKRFYSFCDSPREVSSCK